MRKGIPSEANGAFCTGCIRYGTPECTFYGGPLTKRVRSDIKEYIRQIEDRLQRLTKLFRHLHPDLDLDLLLQHDDTVLLNTDPTSLSRFSATPPSETPPPEMQTKEDLLSAVIRTPVEPVDAFEDPGVSEVSEHFEKLAIRTATERTLFFGKSSSISLLHDVTDLQRESDGRPTPLFHKRREFWSPSWLESARRLVADTNLEGGPAQPPRLYQFPDDDLMPILIENFFEQYNTFYPILHRPTFSKSLTEKLHLTHRGFGGIVLLVCAIGSRHSHDPRVLLDGVDDSNQSQGWKFFSQVSFVRNTVLFTPTLYDLQAYCLALEFLSGTTESHSCWLLIGIGIRLAQEIGVHRLQRKKHAPPTIEDELWKRVFWTLVCEDRLVSSMLGRTCAIGGDDLDLDLPTALDDEYCEVNPHGEGTNNRFSLIESFNQSIRLEHILGTALRTIYCSNKSKVALGLLGEWQQPIVAQLDSSLNQWLEGLPEHLRWDPNSEDSQFFRQSAYLQVQFYYVQIVIHRPFLRTSSSLAATSMAICANAARRCVHVIDVCSRVAPSLNLPLASAASFISGIVLLLNLLTAKRSGQPANQEKVMADLRKCMEQQKRFEEWSPVSGRIWDVLNNLVPAGRHPEDAESPSHSQPVLSSTTGDQGMVGESSSSAPTSMSPDTLSSDWTTSLGQEYSLSDTQAYDQMFEAYFDPFLMQTSSSGGNYEDDGLPSTVPYQASPFSVGTGSGLESGYAMDIWMNTPSGPSLDDWGQYLANLDGSQSDRAS